MTDGSSIVMTEPKPAAWTPPDQRAVRARRLVFLLVMVAVAIYFGFIMMMAWR
jgi:hypothetical protein